MRYIGYDIMYFDYNGKEFYHIWLKELAEKERVDIRELELCIWELQ
jgi:hypothetical protein